jgi:hypothetical protein
MMKNDRANVNIAIWVCNCLLVLLMSYMEVPTRTEGKVRWVTISESEQKF